MTVNKDALIGAIIESGGAIAVAAESAGCSVSTIYSRRKSDPDIAEAIDDARFNYDCETGDMAESKLRQLIEEGYWPAIKFALSTKFKSRGYTDKIEVEHTGVQKINVFFGPKANKAEDE